MKKFLEWVLNLEVTMTGWFAIFGMLAIAIAVIKFIIRIINWLL